MIKLKILSIAFGLMAFIVFAFALDFALDFGGMVRGLGWIIGVVTAAFGVTELVRWREVPEPYERKDYKILRMNSAQIVQFYADNPQEHLRSYMLRQKLKAAGFDLQRPIDREERDWEDSVVFFQVVENRVP